MKPSKLLIGLFIFTATLSANSYGNNKVSFLEGPYVGQTPPSDIPKAFTPSQRSPDRRDHSGFFTPDMKSFYFTRRNNKDGKWSLRVFNLENNQWHESLVGPRVGRPITSPDGNTMHLGKHYMERTKTGWSEIKSLGAYFKDFRIMRLMSSAKGTYYFDDANESTPIHYSSLINGKYTKPKAVNIDFGDWNAHPFIAPDESYLIWDEQGENGYGKADLFISFRQKDGTWGAAINFGETINTTASESGAIVTPDGKYLLFNRFVNDQNAGMYWVDAQIIETLRAKS